MSGDLIARLRIDHDTISADRSRAERREAADEIERLQEEVAAMRAMLANPVGMVSAPSGTLPYKHLVRVREPLDAEIGCSLYAIRDSALRR